MRFLPRPPLLKWVRSIPASIRFGTIALFTAAIVILGGWAIDWHASQPVGQPPISQSSPTPIALQLPVVPPKPAIQGSAHTLTRPSPLAIAPAKPVPFDEDTGLSRVRSVPTRLGHFPYAEAEPNRLQAVGHFERGTYERPETLDVEAANAFGQMVNAAATAGIQLMPISGFRSIADQQDLFARQVQRQGSETAAAKMSAPPGHSEHHTGYAIDIADGQQGDTDLKIEFQTTRAYQWLAQNAQAYGFEQSFPAHNPQGVSFEPWHWRYVQSPRAAQIFAAARTQFPSS